MSMPYDAYEAVIGLEVHAQLLTRSKAFCADGTEYGASPNTLVGVISLGHPGTLPKHNRQAIELSVKMGLATRCHIREINQYARKNYFYADLPKGYQITQDKTPLCFGGELTVQLKDGSEKRIGITRIHMEEDSGKSMHDQDLYDSLIDYNRAGTALIEIVSEPDIRSGEEAYAYLTEIRKIVRYLDICDGNMEEGSLRCDANISVRKKGASAFGTKVEVKNMNSIRNVQRAIDFEIKRQIDLLESGETFTSETRNFDAIKGITLSMRSKEEANDYRYFPEPDLPPVHITPAWLEKIKANMPALPAELLQQFVSEYGLGEYDARVLTDAKETAHYFMGLCRHTKNYKAAANWIMGPIKSYLNEQGLELTDFPVPHEALGQLISMVDAGMVSHSAAAQKILPELIQQPKANPEDVAKALNLLQESSTDNLLPIIEAVLAAYPDKIEEYRAGKKNLMGLFVGEVMKRSGGKADPRLTTQLLNEKLNG